MLIGQDSHGGTDNNSWWPRTSGQSDHGILLKVKEETKRALGRNITELLLFAATIPRVLVPATPTASSSLVPAEDAVKDLSIVAYGDIRVYGLPLCSDILEYAQDHIGLASPPSEPYFLPYGVEQTPAANSATQKHQNLTSLFEDATKKRRKLKGRGGENISKAMSEIDRPTTQSGLPRPEKEQTPPALHIERVARRGLSRASTIYTLPSTGHAHNAIANGKRSSLYRVESALLPRNSPALAESDNAFTAQNKAALSKIVMAGMRLHGLSQRKKPIKDERLRTANSATVEPPESEDDYKLVYHQTFKAASFALRAHINCRVIGQEVMRDVVDRLLALFCTDLMVNNFLRDEFPGSSARSGELANGFDLPSVGAIDAGVGTVWSTPKVKG